MATAVRMVAIPKNYYSSHSAIRNIYSCNGVTFLHTNRLQGMRCQSKFLRDPSYREIKCALPKGHAGWCEYGTTLWENPDEKPEPRQKVKQ